MSKQVFPKTSSQQQVDRTGETGQGTPPPKQIKRKHFLTQDDRQGPPDIPAIVRFSTFSSDRVRRLSSNSFTLDDKMLIGLKFDDCILVLFHVENKESHDLMKIWYLVAEQTAGPIYAACNVLLESKVGEAFARVRMDGSHPLNPYALRQWPVILVYRKGFPVAVYNGEHDIETIIDWSLILACRAEYFEPMQAYAGMQAEFRHDSPTPLLYPNDTNNPLAEVSTQFYSSQGKRGYIPAFRVIRSGSPEDEEQRMEVQEYRDSRLGKNATREELMNKFQKNPETMKEKEYAEEVREALEGEEEGGQPQQGKKRVTRERKVPAESAKPATPPPSSPAESTEEGPQNVNAGEEGV